jgi:hypothetical protein
MREGQGGVCFDDSFHREVEVVGSEGLLAAFGLHAAPNSGGKGEAAPGRLTEPVHTGCLLNQFFAVVPK